MIELQIKLDVYPDKEQELEAAFTNYFVPAISVQNGFISVTLLKPNDAMHEYQIQLRFKSEEQRQAWVASDEHQKAFPKVAEQCLRVSWRGFDIID